MTLIYIYNLLLTILYTTTLALCFHNFLFEKSQHIKKGLLALTVFFIFFTLDNWIISMTELIASFERYYNQTFSGLPLIKTVTFLVRNYCMIYTIRLLKQENVWAADYVLLTVNMIWMLIMPLFPSSQTQVFLYYLPNQLFLAYCGLQAVPRNTKPLNQISQKYLKKAALVMMLFAFLILLEDSFVIFNIDNYDKLAMRIQNRNFSEDLFSVSVSIITIAYLIRDYPHHKQTERRKLDKEERAKYYIDAFCRDYQLTKREKEIFLLLLEHRHNQEIADALFLSLGTVKTHIHNIYVKLNVNKREAIDDFYQTYCQKLKD
ncbi:LuxR family transcriptional regulator [Streptococcus chenjunshii]|uniref:LuxR family transcriptional regulator n=1 Tax=Streptococcus chenjunshii TaxID=2173853 RepID=A0A372KMK0_9STRE|nr:helix-turn-helix transcriptional regulator [Streptococcus chenjunshii]AXQ79592.1 LuxR family transcriptional regulator [Streptococcus chenjunshii]RFU51507.1 LuxR family transcriptional regulator [Streptococcus chenjunshii]RFU53512.1 LuxR family transcriptional regulator [Streptococcus chenjunshii]